MRRASLATVLVAMLAVAGLLGPSNCPASLFFAEDFSGTLSQWDNLLARLP